LDEGSFSACVKIEDAWRQIWLRLVLIGEQILFFEESGNKYLDATHLAAPKFEPGSSQKKMSEDACYLSTMSDQIDQLEQIKSRVCLE
jgi:hypothetical protein